MEQVLTGQVALVTGASAPNGIGRAVCLRLARTGAFVVATDIGGEVMLADGARDRAVLLADVLAGIESAGGHRSM